jgi:outer membrane protein
MTVTRHAVTLVAALLVASFSPKVFAQVRIAVVDLQRAMNETEDGRRAKNQLKRMFKQRQKTLDEKQESLKVLKEELEKQRDVLSRDALAKRLEDYQKQFVELQGVYVEYQRELAQKEGELTQKILEKMQDILRRIGQRDGYTLIVERNEGGVIWSPTHIDLTDQVIQQYNTGEGASEGGGGNTKKKAP